MVTCTICDKNFAHAGSLASHKWRYHRNESSGGNVYSSEDNYDVSEKEELVRSQNEDGSEVDDGSNHEESQDSRIVTYETDESIEDSPGGIEKRKISDDIFTSSSKKRQIWRPRGLKDYRKDKRITNARALKRKIDRLHTGEWKLEGCELSEPEQNLLDGIYEISNLHDIAAIMEENKDLVESLATKIERFSVHVDDFMDEATKALMIINEYHSFQKGEWRLEDSEFDAAELRTIQLILKYCNLSDVTTLIKEGTLDRIEDKRRKFQHWIEDESVSPKSLKYVESEFEKERKAKLAERYASASRFP